MRCPISKRPISKPIVRRRAGGRRAVVDVRSFVGVRCGISSIPSAVHHV
ncbi:MULTISPECIES: hypothetical protein [Gordonia]|nr:MULTISPECIES: hypothetical protein [Gordonia]